MGGNVLVLFACGLLVIGGAFGGEEVNLFEIEDRFLKNNIEGRRSPLDDISPEIDSREHGVSTIFGKRKTSCQCGIANRRAQSRIVGGREYGQFEYPFLALVSYSTRPLSPHCGSVIITRQHILTAAHCTEKAINGVTLLVRVAEHDKGRTPGAYTVPVERLIQHEKYNTNNLHNDISLLFLKNSLIMSGAVIPACMPLPGLDITGKYVRAVGFGATRFKGPTTQRPQKVDLRVIDTGLCHQMWPLNVIKHPKSQICTMSKKRTTCQGDSGGPIVWLDPETNRYTIVGLVSAGPEGCTDAKPAVHTSIVTYLPWIMKGIQATAPGSMPCNKV
uniref:Venom s1 protease 10 n=1 Tax=Pristhesancus plagipennis TaxID=1955184 RepID=A0A1Q1NPF1_PRIPG|nr:venom s1 protease 10 [Pristhesancus plagipennis]